ncbi:NUMOD4 domain-containing protein [Staphylococcus chromogenes]|uniref:NUMOD4 domain-containing protein n=1 Tax=Staphylococcus chromogenes TaxID=46126 RepID=UPI003B004A09
MEIWKDINGYENLYKISNHGRVWSCKKNQFIKPNNNGNGYHRISLYKNGATKSMYIHRLVGLHFLPLIKGKELINHIDENRSNNHVSNLEWCNSVENAHHLEANMRAGRSRVDSEKWQACIEQRSVPVIAVNDNEKIRFKSLSEAERQGYTKVIIKQCIEGKREYYRNYKWYKEGV